MNPDSRTTGRSEGVESASPSVRSAVADVQAEGRRLADEARHGAVEIAEKRKRATSDYMQALSSAMGACAEELKRQGQQTSASYAVAAADEIGRLAARLSERDTSILVRDLEDFARRRPALFFGAAVVAGAGLARFFKSSAAGGHSEGPFRESAPPHSTSRGDFS